MHVQNLYLNFGLFIILGDMTEMSVANLKNLKRFENYYR